MVSERIQRETRRRKHGRIRWKLNHLTEPDVINALYEVSSAGVQIDLCVRGTCCLRPSVKGVSDHIRVISILGRFLEHSRIFYFENGDKPEMLIGSADVMRRNLKRRVEVLVPVEDPLLLAHLRDRILAPFFKENIVAWNLQSDGTYVQRKGGARERIIDVQHLFLSRPSTKELLSRTAIAT